MRNCVACSVWWRDLSELFLLSPVEMYPAGDSWAWPCWSVQPIIPQMGVGVTCLCGDLAGCSKSQAFSSCLPVPSLMLSPRKFGPKFYTLNIPLLMGHAGLGPRVPSTWLYPSDFLISRGAASARTCVWNPGPCQIMGLALAPLLKELLCGPQAAAPVSWGPVLHVFLLPNNHGLMDTAGHWLSEPPMVLEKVSLWIFPG